MNDFPANSQKTKGTEPREKIKPVTSAETVRRKRGLGRQFKDTFFSGGGRDTLGHMVEEVVVPSIKDMIADAWHAGVDRLIYGDTRGPHRRSSGYHPGVSNSAVPRVDYRSISGGNTRASSSQNTMSRSSRARHEFDDLVIAERQDAETVIDRMFDILSMDGEVTVAHLYELTGIRPDHTDFKWGWTSLRGAKVLRLRQGGFLLDLPRPEALR